MNELPRYSLKEVAKHDGKNEGSLWIIINDMVYDVTDYKHKHPGGKELLEEYAGQDATRAFDEFGHSLDAKRMLKTLLVGELMEEDKISNRRKENKISTKMETQRNRRGFLSVLCCKCIT
ncbi:cytochrome b5-like [Bombus impatiens]|uniref:Cytochrome b5-like n=1 Tax=Bombus impatiens TaxID=132113 RepID=A0A6P3DRG9_BOMIM|nr:cytochrome b5-like [Bombus impatiens]